MDLKIRILHIDDNALDRQLVRDALMRESDTYEVISVDNRILLEKALSEENFDLVLTDFDILGFSGLQVLQIVKDKKPDVPVILITGTGTEEIAIEAMKMGASDYVLKSAKCIHGLPHIINKVLDNKRAQEERNKALSALKENEALYRTLFENSRLAIFLLTMDGKVLSVNPYACRLFEKTEEEFLKSTREDFVETKDQRFQTIIEEKLKTGHAEGELIFKKGKYKHFPGEIDTTIFKNNDGIDQTILFIRDITEKKLAEKKLYTLNKAIEQSPTSTVITDNKGVIEFVNDKFTSTMQYSLDEVIGKRPRIFNQGHLPDKEFYAMLKTLEEGRIWQKETQNRKKDGSMFWENVVISPLLDDEGAITNYIIIMDDITEKKKLFDDLVIAKEQAEESDRLKTAFLHNISHEIRTPMNSIIGFAGLLNDPDIEKGEKDQFTEAIVQSSNQLLSIITELIEIATIETGQVRITESKVELNTTLKLIYNQFQLNNKNPNVKLILNLFQTDKELLIITDSTKLSEIIVNLVENALKFTAKGFVEFGYTIDKNNLMFYVADTGIGIPPEMHEVIFKRFHQASVSTSSVYGGSGLGLSISKAYVELLGGKIWLKSELGTGTTFYFTLPYKRYLTD